MQNFANFHKFKAKEQKAPGFPCETFKELSQLPIQHIKLVLTEGRKRNETWKLWKRGLLIARNCLSSHCTQRGNTSCWGRNPPRPYSWH